MNSLPSAGLIFLLNLFAESVHCTYHTGSDKFHRIKRPDQKLTSHEFLKTFHDAGKSGSIEYEFVVMRTENDDNAAERLVEFDIKETKYYLKLVPVDMSEPVIVSGTPVMEVETINGESYKYRTVVHTDGRHNGTNLYQDVARKATLLMHYINGVEYYDGVFGEGKDMRVIKSAPARFLLDYEAGKHFIYSIDSNEYDVILDENDDSAGPPHTQKSLDTFYPKLLVLVDYTLYKNLDQGLLESMRYLTVFWNAVNLKYRDFTKPKVHIKVTGFVFSKDVTALKYLNDAKDPKNDTKIVSNNVLKLGRWHFKNDFYKLTNFDNYDSTFTVASLYEDGGVTGSACLNGICSYVNNIGYFRDFGNYIGVMDAAHELGHLLSMPHDPSNCLTGLTDTESIMAATGTLKSKNYIWSFCSKQALRDFAINSRSECMAHPNRTRIHS